MADLNSALKFLIRRITGDIHKPLTMKGTKDHEGDSRALCF